MAPVVTATSFAFGSNIVKRHSGISLPRSPWKMAMKMDVLVISEVSDYCSIRV